MALRILIAILILAVPLELPGCGPDLPEAVFHRPVWPEDPQQFARGRLGILPPTYERLYQVIAYRHLTGAGLSDAAWQTLSLGPLPSTPGPAPLDPPQAWLAARNASPRRTAGSPHRNQPRSEEGRLFRFLPQLQ